MIDGKRLEMRLRRSIYYRVAAIVSAIAVAIWLLVLSGINLNSPTKDYLVAACFYLFLGLFAWLMYLLQKFMLHRFLQPLREAKTSQVIHYADTWQLEAHRQASLELILRARLGDLMARNYLYGRSYAHLDDLDGLAIHRNWYWPWALRDPVHRLKVIDIGGSFRTVSWRGAMSPQVRVLLFVFLLIAKGVAVELDRGVTGLSWTSFVKFLPLLALSGVVLGEWIVDGIDPAKLPFDQLVFLYVRGGEVFRPSIAEAMKRRAPGLGPEAVATCNRLGITLRDRSWEEWWATKPH